MKLLVEVIDFNEATRIRVLFWGKGIPLFIGNEDSARNFGIIYPVRKYAIFVVFEEQYYDAVKLLADEHHEVTNPVDMEEYQQITEIHSSVAFNNVFKYFMLSTAFAVFVTIGLVLLAVFA